LAQETQTEINKLQHQVCVTLERVVPKPCLVRVTPFNDFIRYVASVVLANYTFTTAKNTLRGGPGWERSL